MLGAVFALLSAASFALNNVTARRGVVTGTPFQGMAISVPMGVACFLPVVIATGEIARVAEFSLRAAAWMAGLGLVHFIFGRFFNYSANQAAGVNLTAPVIQLQVLVTLVLAVVILHEPCSVLQMIGAVLIFAGSIVTQQQNRSRPAAASPAATARGAAATDAARRTFEPQQFKGYVFAVLAALAYGSTPIMARFALEGSSPARGVLGGLISYVAATAVVAIALLWPPIRSNVMAIKRESARWFAVSGVCVAMAQGFFFAAVAVAPVLLVMPLLQTSLVFRIMFSTWFNPDHEVSGWLVRGGVAISITGALLVSIDTDLILNALAVPQWLAQILRWRV